MGKLNYSTAETNELLGEIGYATNPNLLDNPWFTVNQRGWTTGAGTAYCVDRWKVNAGGLTATVNSDKTITLTKAAGSWASFSQPLESPLASSGQTCTLSVMTSDGAVYSATREYGSGYSNITINGLAIRAYMSDTAITLYMLGAAEGSITIKAVKIEVGSVSTLANDVPPNYAEELLKCQRYFLRVLRNGGYSVDVAFGVADSTTTARITIPTPVPMAKAPTVSMSGTVRIQSGGSGHEITNISNYQSVTNVGVQIHPTTSGLTNGDNVILSLGSNGAYIDLSADL